MAGDSPQNANEIPKWQFRLGLFVCSIMVTVIVLAVLQMLRQPPPRSGIQEEPPPDLSNRPFTVVGKFVEEIKGRQYDQAYVYLAPHGKPPLSERDFREQLTSFQGELEKADMTVLRERVIGETGWVEVGPRSGAPEPTWKLTLVDKGGRWKITELEGKPFTAE